MGVLCAWMTTLDYHCNLGWHPGAANCHVRIVMHAWLTTLNYHCNLGWHPGVANCHSGNDRNVANGLMMSDTFGEFLIIGCRGVSVMGFRCRWWGVGDAVSMMGCRW